LDRNCREIRREEEKEKRKKKSTMSEGELKK